MTSVSSPVPVTDIHIHVQPWEELRPEAAARMAHGRDREHVLRVMRDPELLLRLMDEAGVERAGLVNYVSPDVMGFTARVNAFATDYARHAPARLLPFGSVHPRFTRDPGGEVDRIADLGVRALKIHPPHQLLAANAYRDGGDCPGLALVYERAVQRRLPVMIHTGTSVFPGARNKYADPMAIDDVAVDYPELVLIMAHGGRPLYMETCFFLLRTGGSTFTSNSTKREMVPAGLLRRMPHRWPWAGSSASPEAACRAR